MAHPPGMGGQPQTNRSRIDRHTKLYDAKIAQMPANQHDGNPTDGSGPARHEWAKKYLVGQAPDVEPTLHWAELQ